MRKEIQSLMSGKSLPFMASISEKLDIKASAEYEIEKMKVAKNLIREESEEEDELEEKLHGDQHKLDHNEDGDIDAEDMKTVKKKGANNDHPMKDKK